MIGGGSIIERVLGLVDGNLISLRLVTAICVCEVRATMASERMHMDLGRNQNELKGTNGFLRNPAPPI